MEYGFQNPKTMRASPKAYELIERSEGLTLTARPDFKGLWFIGYGHTAGVKAGDVIDKVTAHQLELKDVQAVEHVIARTVGVLLKQGMYDAIVDWIFNLGATEWQRSHALRALNEANYQQCIQHMHGYIHAGGHALAALIIRRHREVVLWHDVDAPEPEL